MNRTVRCLAAAVLVTATLATGPAAHAAPKPFSVGLVGDWGYTPDEQRRLPTLVDAMNRAGLAFTVHDGDIKNGPPPCSDNVYWSTRNLFDRFVQPLVYTPGDNEWTDCWRSGSDPVNRLAFLRKVFFPSAWTRGQRPMVVRRQSAAYPENARWERGGVLFATLHVVGSNNGLPSADRQGNRQEHAARDTANIAWMRAAFAQAMGFKSKAVILFMQGDPWFQPPKGQRFAVGYERFMHAMAAEVEKYPGRVVLVHGDTHEFKVDNPPLIGSPPRPSPRFTRVESYGPKDTRWVQLDIDANTSQVFRVRTAGP